MDLENGLYTGSKHMGKGGAWSNRIHPDFRAGALKFFAVSNRNYAVKYHESGKLSYACTTHMNTNADSYQKLFHDSVMQWIPGYKQ